MYFCSFGDDFFFCWFSNSETQKTLQKGMFDVCLKLVMWCYSMCCLKNKKTFICVFVVVVLSGLHVADAGRAKLQWTVENVLVAEMVDYANDLISTPGKLLNVANGSACTPSVRTGVERYSG